MLGLFGTLNLGTRSLQTQQTGVEVTGQNLANVNNTAYARQRVQIETSITLPSGAGPQGTGAQVTAIEQVRNALLDGQIRAEQSVGGYWEAQQSALQQIQAGLGELLNRSADSVSATSGTSSSSSLSDALTGLFNAFQSVAASPNSLPEQQALVSAAQTLSTRFNDISKRLTESHDQLDASLTQDISSANQLFSDIADLNDQIAKAELPMGGTANDLRDMREKKLEELGKLVDFQTSTAADGSVDISIGGITFVSGNQVADTLETFGWTGQSYGGNELLAHSVKGQSVVAVHGGSIAGTIDTRDGALKQTRDDLNVLAGHLINSINTVYRTGFSSTGTTGSNFFAGTNAATMAVDPTLLSNPSLLQSAGAANSPGDNSIVLALAQLAQQKFSGLNNQTYGAAYGKIVADFGYSLQNANDQLANHDSVNGLLLKQRDSISGVSIDEEMTNLLTYQKAYQASAKIVTTVDEMLDTILNMKR